MLTGEIVRKKAMVVTTKIVDNPKFQTFEYNSISSVATTQAKHDN